jgi:hypothetical protein
MAVEPALEPAVWAKPERDWAAPPLIGFVKRLPMNRLAWFFSLAWALSLGGVLTYQ